MSETEKDKMLRGELYYAFTPMLAAERDGCRKACSVYNRSKAEEVDRREQLMLLSKIVTLIEPLPPKLADPTADAAQLENFPWILPPFKADYGSNIRLGSNVFINFNCTMLDTCLISIGSRTLLGPNVSLFSAAHPLDPELRNGTSGPEYGKEIHVGEDCWIGGNVTILPGVKIGQGATVGAGSVVTKDVEAYTVVAGNPARLIREIDCPAGRRYREMKAK